MTPEQFAEKMREIHADPEGLGPPTTHGQSDDLMCQVLRELGYGEGVDIFEQSKRWYE